MALIFTSMLVHVNRAAAYTAGEAAGVQRDAPCGSMCNLCGCQN